MNCEETIERLPWLLNGTLEPGEEREVRAHLASCETCRAALAETRLAWQAFAQHVPSEDLVAWAFDDRPTLDPGLIERHLEECPRCAAELELVRASRLLGEHDEVALLRPRPPAATAPARTSRGWRSAALAAGLTGLIAIGGWVASESHVRSLETRLAGAQAPSPMRGGSVRPMPTPAPAAGAAERLARLEEEKRRLEAETRELRAETQKTADRMAQLESRLGGRMTASAAAGVAVVADVYSSLATRGDAERANELRLPPGARFATVILHPKATPGPGPRAVELLDAAGTVRWKTDALTASPEGDYALTLSRDLLRPGAYTLRVRGPEGTETFPLTVH